MFLYRSVRSVHFARVLVGFVYSSIRRRPRLQVHVARVYFQQPIATQIALQAVPYIFLSGKAKSQPAAWSRAGVVAPFSHVAIAAVVASVTSAVCSVVCSASVACLGCRAFSSSFCWPRGMFDCDESSLSSSSTASTELKPSLTSRSTVFAVILCAVAHSRSSSSATTSVSVIFGKSHWARGTYHAIFLSLRTISASTSSTSQK